MATYVVGGSPAARPPLGLAPGPDDRVIAADLGAAWARAWGWPVHLLVGDLDSLPAGAATAERIIRAPAAKDETDLELALAEALTGDSEEIIICAALGGRTDHLLANVLLLASPELAGRSVRLVDGPETLRLLRGADERPTPWHELAGARGDLLSLVPLAGDVAGVSTQGLLYPLHDETLFFARARGVSNVFAGDRAAVRLRRGLLLAIHTACVASRSS